MSEALKFSDRDKPASGHTNRPLITAKGRTLADVDTDQVVALHAGLACQEGSERKRQACIWHERAQPKARFGIPLASVASGARLSRFQVMAWR